MRIAISGLSGCGNTTVGKLVGQTFGYPVFNYTFRDLACDLDIELHEITGSARSDIFDLLVVVATLRAAQAGNIIIGNRLATWVSNADLNFWLEASLAERAIRISNREKITVDITLEQTATRDEENRRHFLKLFGLDVRDYRHVNSIIDTETIDAEQVAAAIVDFSRSPHAESEFGRTEQKRIVSLLEEKFRMPKEVLLATSGNFSLKDLFEQAHR